MDPIKLSDLVPLGDRVLVRPQTPESKTKSGIIIPDQAQEKRTLGTVVAVGPGPRDEHGKRIKMDVEKGDVVYYEKYGGSDIEVAGEKLVMLRETDLLGTVTQGKSK